MPETAQPAGGRSRRRTFTGRPQDSSALRTPDKVKTTGISSPSRKSPQENSGLREDWMSRVTRTGVGQGGDWKTSACQRSAPPSPGRVEEKSSVLPSQEIHGVSS